MDEGGRSSSERRDAIAREAAGWFASWQAGTIDEQAFERWRAFDPAHALAYARVMAVWEAMGRNEGAAETTSVTRRRLVGASVAGAALLAAGSGLFASRAYAWESASTGVGETRKLRLPDNSMIALNTDTALYWRFSTTKRELWLERGEVALDLEPGPDARLRTRHDGAALTGGRFNARLQDDALDLIVFRGGAFPADSALNPAALQAKPHHRLSFAGGVPVIKPVSSNAAEAVLAWQSGDIVFFDTPLSEAIAEYNRYLLRKIVIDDRSVGAVRVGGRFVSSDPADFLKAISTSLGVRVQETATGYHLDK
ncbi:FecR domain-containing protein [Sphingomonas sp. BT-65]|uniref:FecR family protein n=1 Tax=Sphingomonas sp. BT-65 TaxID=2989821 RepID=UPI0022362326|nr:FecR domain-containing protein [Sphingomonas sp. BT-65]MCW4463536.1 FecR domain-containing protein [Sphingomonas sp. BT-65]